MSGFHFGECIFNMHNAQVNFNAWMDTCNEEAWQLIYYLVCSNTFDLGHRILANEFCV